MDTGREHRRQGNGHQMQTSVLAQPSYSSGTSTVPLLGDTIGANLDRTAARVGDH